MALDLVEKYGLSHFMEVSAKEGTGITELVHFIAKLLYESYSEDLQEYKESDGGSMSDMTPVNANVNSNQFFKDNKQQ